MKKKDTKPKMSKHLIKKQKNSTPKKREIENAYKTHFLKNGSNSSFVERS